MAVRRPKPAEMGQDLRGNAGVSLWEGSLGGRLFRLEQVVTPDGGMKGGCPWMGSLEVSGFVKEECLGLTGCRGIGISRPLLAPLGLSTSFHFHFYFHASLVSFIFFHS